MRRPPRTYTWSWLTSRPTPTFSLPLTRNYTQPSPSALRLTVNSGTIFWCLIWQGIPIDAPRQENGIDVEGYTVDFKDNHQRKEYEKARTILVGLHREVDDYSRSMTEARCHWTVSAEKFKPPENPIQRPTGN